MASSIDRGAVTPERMPAPVNNMPPNDFLKADNTELRGLVKAAIDWDERVQSPIALTWPEVLALREWRAKAEAALEGPE